MGQVNQKRKAPIQNQRQPLQEILIETQEPPPKRQNIVTIPDDTSNVNITDDLPNMELELTDQDIMKIIADCEEENQQLM